MLFARCSHAHVSAPGCRSQRCYHAPNGGFGGNIGTLVRVDFWERNGMEPAPHAAPHGVIDIPEGPQWLGLARTEKRGERLVRAIRFMNVDAGFALTCAMLLLATHAMQARAQEY